MSIDFSAQLYAAFTDEIEKIAGARRVGRIARSIARKADAGAEAFSNMKPGLSGALRNAVNKHERRMERVAADPARKAALVAADPEKHKRSLALRPKAQHHAEGLARAKTEKSLLKHTSGFMHTLADAARVNAAKPGSLGAAKTPRGLSPSQRAVQSRVERRLNEDQRILNLFSEPTPTSAATSRKRGGGGRSGGASSRSSAPASGAPAAYRPAPPKRKNGIVPALVVGGAGLGALALGRAGEEE